MPIAFQDLIDWLEDDLRVKRTNVHHYEQNLIAIARVALEGDVYKLGENAFRDSMNTAASFLKASQDELAKSEMKLTAACGALYDIQNNPKR
jgi:hypothetical protein